MPFREGRLMRRIIVVEPLSRCAIWSKRMALMALAVTSIALVLTRNRQIELDAGMVAILGGLGFALLALTLALLAFARIWSEGRRGLGSALAGFLLASALLALPAYVGGLRLYAPQPRDLATDPVDPPAFTQLTDALPQRPGILDRLIPQAPMTQSWRARAQVPPLYLDVPLAQAHDLARRAAGIRGLRIAEPPEPLVPEDEPRRDPDAPPPLPPPRPAFLDNAGPSPATVSARTGEDMSGESSRGFEASGETPILRLPLRLSVRLTPIGDRVRIDARVTAPQGNYDIGANAALLRRYLDEIAFLENPR
jgi:hypothetical protein